MPTALVLTLPVTSNKNKRATDYAVIGFTLLMPDALATPCFVYKGSSFNIR